MEELIKRCWHGDPVKRPNFEEISKILIKETEDIISKNKINKEGKIKIKKFVHH